MAKQSLDDVIVKLVSTSTKGFLFNAYSADDKVKYLGEISQDHKSDSCTCMGNTMGNNCKHIKKAHLQMEGFW
jgi:hypothetical protein